RVPRPPTPFPTRRSSDLFAKVVPVGVRALNSAYACWTVLLGVRGELCEGDFERVLHQLFGVLHALIDDLHYGHEDVRIVAEDLLDRKSTRLNSSHGSISY